MTDVTLKVQELLSKGKDVTIGIEKGKKTHEQLGYLHSHVLGQLALALHDSGEIRNNSESAAKYWLKRRIGYGNYYTFGEHDVVFDPDSFQRATIETLTQAIDCAIDECAKRGIYVKPPRS